MSRFHPSALLQDALGALLVRGMGIVLTFTSMTIAAWLLGPTEYGTYATALSLAMLLASLAPLGTDRVLSKSLSLATCPREIGRETALTHACMIVVAIFFLAGILLTSQIASGVLLNPRQARLIQLSALLFVPLALTYLRQWIAIPLIGTRKALTTEQTLLPLGFTISIVAFKQLGIGLTASTAAISYAIVMILAVTMAVASGPLRPVYAEAARAGTSITLSAVLGRLRLGFPFAIVSAGGVASQTLMPLTIAACCSMEDTACFALALPYAALPAIPLGIFSLSTIPQCAQLYRDRNFPAANQLVRSTATFTFLMAVGAAAAVWIGSPLLSRLLGNSYAEVGRVFPLLLLATMVDCLTGPTIPVMQTMGLETQYTRMLVIFLPVQLALVYFLGKSAGLHGAGVGYLLSRCLWNLAIVWQIHKQRGLLMLPFVNLPNAIREYRAPTIPTKISNLTGPFSSNTSSTNAEAA